MNDNTRSIIEASANNFNRFNDLIEDFDGLRNITTTEDFKIANDAIDRLFKDIDGDV